LIWKKTDEQPVGHIAVVCEVGNDYVCIAEQNVDNNKMWAGGNYSRKFMLERNEENSSWTIRDDEVKTSITTPRASFR
jgi:trypanothione synthetase/amidase